MLAKGGPVQPAMGEAQARPKRSLNARILLLTPDLENSGIGRQAVDLALRVRAAGGHPFIASPGGILKLELQRQKIPHKNLPDVNASALGHMLAVHQLASYIREAQIHFIHAVDFSLGRFVYEVMLKTGRHVAISLNQPVLNTLSSKGVEILRSFTRIFVPSNFAREQLVQQLRLHESVVTTVIPGINLSVVHNDRISPQKIMDLEKKWQIPDEHPLVVVPDCPTDAVLFDTFATVLRELKEKNVYAVLFVPEADRNFILRRVAAAGLKTHVVVSSDMADRLAALWLAHSVLITGFWGRLSLLALIEAQAMGRPIVAFDRNGIGEILLKDPATLLLAADQIGRLPGALLKSLSLSGDQRNVFARRARAYVESNFERTQMYDDILDVYRDIKDIQN